MNRTRKQDAVEGLGRLPEGRPGKEAVTNLYMERNKMNVRHIVVAVSAAAILAGSSYGALAGGYHKKAYSKGESYSKVESKAYFRHGSPVAETEQMEHTTAFTNQNNGGAGADAGTTGGALAVGLGSPAISVLTFTHSLGGNVQAAAAWGSTSGGSCAGSGCAGSPE
jgi:hypothetical protein